MRAQACNWQESRNHSLENDDSSAFCGFKVYGIKGLGSGLGSRFKGRGNMALTGILSIGLRLQGPVATVSTISGQGSRLFREINT